MNFIFTFQPDVATDTGDQGVITNDFNFEEETAQGIMAAATIFFTPPNDDIESHIVVDPEVVPRTLWFGLIEEANWNSDDEDWVSFVELLLGQGYPDSYLALLEGPTHRGLFSFQTLTFLDGIATACEWFRQPLDLTIIYVADSKGNEVVVLNRYKPVGRS